MVENNQENVQQQELTEINIDAMSDRKLGQTFEKPAKVELDGQTVTITNVSLKLTPDERTTKDGTKKTRNVIFALEYNNDQVENYGGVSSFVYSDGNVGEPTIWAEGKSAAAKLFNKWLAHVGKKKEDVSFKDFFAGLKGMRVKIATQSVHYMGEEYRKNIVSEFLGQGVTPSSSFSESTPTIKINSSQGYENMHLAGDVVPEPLRPTDEYTTGDSEWFMPEDAK